MSKIKTLKPRVGSLPGRMQSQSRYGLGRQRYAPGRDARRERVFKRDKYRCRKHFEDKGQLVALALHSKDRHHVGYVDHYIPLAQGGDDTESNQWLLCKTCHDAKTAEDSAGIVREPRDFGNYSDELVIA